VLEIVATQAHESLGSLDIAIWLQEVDGGPLHLVTGQGMFSGSLSGRAQPLNADEGVIGRALAERVPVWTADVLIDPRMRLRPESRRWIEEVGGRSILAVPLIREHLAGALVVYRPAGQVWSRREVEYLSAFANQIAVALENARLYKALDVRVRELAVLHELSRSVTGQLDRAGILDTVHRQVVRLLDVQNLSVLLVDEERDRLSLELRVRHGRRFDDGEPLSYPRALAGLSWVVCDTGRSIRTTDYVAECARHGIAPLAPFADMPHQLLVPMAAGDRVLGVLALGSPDRVFTEADERLLGNIA
jgi:GAF domain-containing protein